MNEDIFQFWSRIPDGTFAHPDDRQVLKRVSHRFELDCLPIGFVGPLRTASLVLLFLSPGYTAFDRQHASEDAGRAWYRGQRSGSAPLPKEAEHAPAYRWWSRVVRQFGFDPDSKANKIAVLNIGAYHSEKFHDWHMLTALPSSRVALHWAQTQLFPAAEKGDRLVVCLRSARLWGLARGQSYGQSLFAPDCTPGGIMHRGPLREVVVAAAQARLLTEEGLI